MSGRGWSGRRHRSTDVGLISVVFLLLVFFLIAGTVSHRLPPGLDLVSLDQIRDEPAPGVWVIAASGSVTRDGRSVDLATAEPALAGPAQILADRAAPAAALVDLVSALQAAGAEPITLLGQRSLE